MGIGRGLTLRIVERPGLALATHPLMIVSQITLGMTAATPEKG